MGGVERREPFLLVAGFEQDAVGFGCGELEGDVGAADADALDL